MNLDRYAPPRAPLFYDAHPPALAVDRVQARLYAALALLLLPGQWIHATLQSGAVLLWAPHLMDYARWLQMCLALLAGYLLLGLARLPTRRRFALPVAAALLAGVLQLASVAVLLSLPTVLDLVVLCAVLASAWLALAVWWQGMGWRWQLLALLLGVTSAALLRYGPAAGEGLVWLRLGLPLALANCFLGVRRDG